jgi:GTP cyclohydrolase I
VKKKNRLDLEKIAAGVRLILEGIGEDPQRAGLERTPERVAEMYAELTAGLRENPEAEVQPLPGESYQDVLLAKNISIASLCEHHLAPFTGRCHIAYIPREGRIVGISKLARIAEIYSRRLQVQERLATQIADTLEKGLRPQGALVIIEATHTCMTMRGVKKPEAEITTLVARGVFREQAALRAEIASLLKAA